MLRALLLGGMVLAASVTVAGESSAADVGAGCILGLCVGDASDSTDDPMPDPPQNDQPGGTGPREGDCWQRAMDPQPQADSPWWGGHSAAEGQVYEDVCLVDGFVFRGGIVRTPYFRANVSPAPQISPEALAAQARSMITLEPPTVHLGPESRVAVHRWVYLWVDDPGPLTATATAGAVSVTLTATLKSVEWSMGEPASPTTPGGPQASVTCDGAGQAPGSNSNANVSRPPDPGACVYSFNWRSLPERTGGAGTWSVAAAAHWDVTWSSNVGVGGTLTAPAQISTTPLSVGEWRSELVVGPS